MNKGAVKYNFSSSFFTTLLKWDRLSDTVLRKLQYRVCLVAVKCFPENTYFPKMLISGKGKCIRLFGCLGNHFTENQFRCLVRPNILRKINSHVWFGQTFYEKWNSFFTENQFRCLVCGSFYRKYEMCYKFKHLHYLDKPVTVQN